MVKQISDWKNILLDTSVIIDYIMNPEKITNNDKVKNKIINTHKLFEYFNSTVSETKRTFFISAITLSELRKKLMPHISILESLLSIFNSSDLVFVDFTKEMAMQIHTHQEFLEQDPHLNKFLKELETELNKDGIYQASGWVSDDLKIVATAKFFKGKIDAVLTGDEKTFVPIAERFDIPVVNTFKLPLDMFNQLNVNTNLN